MTNLDKSSRNAVYAALLIISGIAMYAQIVSPHVNRLQAVQNYEPVIDQMIGKQADIKSVLVGRRKVLEDLTEQFNEVSYTVFDPNQMKKFFGSLEQLAEQFECSIAKMDLSADKRAIIVGEATDPSRVESVETTLTVLGEYSQLSQFVDCLQHQERQIWITALDIETTKGQERILKCDITINLYVLQKKMEAGL
jgi:hypothetical protein